MNSSDELAEMKRYWFPSEITSVLEVEFVRAADADRVIATERRLNSEAIAARDARIAELINEIAGHSFVRNERDRLDKALASRDAQLAKARAAMMNVHHALERANNLIRGAAHASLNGEVVLGASMGKLRDYVAEIDQPCCTPLQRPG